LNTLPTSDSSRSETVARIDALLPQTQCTQCDYPRCRLYAEAIADGEARINQCPPGGSQTITALATLTGLPAQPLNPENGRIEERLVARVVEADCIGCKLCIKACPVDCIVGAPKLMHTVIASQCTGCKLCLPVCPTDCILLEPAAPPDPSGGASIWPAFSQQEVDLARMRTDAKLQRAALKHASRQAAKTRKKRDQLKQEIAAAVERKRLARKRPG